MLFELIGDALPQARRDSYRRLVDAWQARRIAQFEEAIAALAVPIAAACCDHEPLPDAGIGGTFREIGHGVGLARIPTENAKTRASNEKTM